MKLWRSRRLAAILSRSRNSQNGTIARQAKVAARQAKGEKTDCDGGYPHLGENMPSPVDALHKGEFETPRRSPEERIIGSAIRLGTQKIKRERETRQASATTKGIVPGGKLLTRMSGGGGVDCGSKCCAGVCS